MLVCPTCGTENPDGFRFCGSCGAALAGADAREVRKTVTALFADVTGSTALGERLDPEALRRVMGRYLQEMRTVLERHGGTVEKFIGDAVMAVFGIPTLHEDDALRAVLAASAMRERLEQLNVELERDFGVRVEARIGVNTGEVVTAQGEAQERLATGDAVNVAARLEQAAEPGQILLGERTLELTRHALEVEAVDPLPLKGKADRVAAYSLLAVAAGAPTVERRFDAPLVGREEELARVRASFDEAVSERRCALVTLLGPPGIGKSRLAREVTAGVHEHALVLAGRCLPYGEGITYWPLREIFAAGGGADELDEALTLTTPEDVFWAVRKALEQRAREKPLALVVEDIHWAEPTLLDLIEHLVDWARDAPILLLCLARPELMDERQGWGRDGVSISLGPLSGNESDELIERLLGDAQLDESTRARIRDVADGNPLFVEQLLAMIAGEGHEGVPPTIQALLAARLDSLPAEERELLERGSVIGLEFEWEALGELAEDGRRPAGSQLAALVRKELIAPNEVIEDTFRFRHILIRDAAYERIPKARRSELHERFAGWLEPRGEEFGEIVAYHLEEAHRSIAELGPVSPRARALAERAGRALIAAGSRAKNRGDGRAAVNLFERAVSMLPPADRARLGALPEFGRALREAGRLEDADAILSEAIETGEEVGDRLVVADATLARTDLRFHQALIPREEVVREIEALTPVFRELRDDAALARALSFGGRLRFWSGDTAAVSASEDLLQSARLARKAGDRAEEALSLQYVIAVFTYGPTPVAEGLARVEEVRPRAHGNGRLQSTLLHAEALLVAMQGDFVRARDLMARARTVADEHGLDTLVTTHTDRVAAEVARLEGRSSAAEGILRSSCERLEEIGEGGYLASQSHRLAEALYVLGRYEEAFEVTERWRPDRLTVPEDADAQAGWRLVRAKLLARRDRVDEGERLMEEARAILAATDFLDQKAHAAADLAELCRLSGRLEEAATARSEAIDLWKAKGNLAAIRLLESAVLPR